MKRLVDTATSASLALTKETGKAHILPPLHPSRLQIKDGIEDVFLLLMTSCDDCYDSFHFLEMYTGIEPMHGIYKTTTSCKFRLCGKAPVEKLKLMQNLVTRVIQVFTFQESLFRRVHFVALPPFGDARHSEVLEHYGRWFSEFSRERSTSFSGIIYLERLSGGRTSTTSAHDFSLIRTVCGDETFPSFAILTMGWERKGRDLINLDFNKYESPIKDTFAEAIEKGTQLFRFYPRNRASAKRVVDTLLAFGNKFTLQIQRESLKDDNVMLAETSAGRALIQCLTERREELEAYLQDIQKNVLKAVQEGDDQKQRNLLADDEWKRMEIAQVGREMDRVRRARLS